MPEQSAATTPVLGHWPESVMLDDEGRSQIVCACSWECWGVEDEDEAWDVFTDHIFDHVKTNVAHMRKVVVPHA